MITELTEAQRARMPYYADKWIKIGFCTEPANREEAEKAIHLCYRNGGIEPPEKIIWCGSPRSMATEGASMDDATKGVKGVVWYAVYGFIEHSVGKSVWDAAWKSVWEAVLNSLWVVMYPVANSVGNSLWSREGVSVYDLVAHCGLYDYMREELKLVEQTEGITGMMELAKHCGGIAPFKNVCFASERPNVVNLDSQSRIHCENGPAIAYPDGWNIYAVHGVRVPEYVIRRPHEITVKKIDEEKNAETRRVMIDRYGPKRYIQDSGAKIIHQDKYGVLFKKNVKDDEPIVMVKVINSTPEPDGTCKEYFLRVPPDMKTAHQAVAWTFNKTPETYNPIIET